MQNIPARYFPITFSIYSLPCPEQLVLLSHSLNPELMWPHQAREFWDCVPMLLLLQLSVSVLLIAELHAHRLMCHSPGIQHVTWKHINKKTNKKKPFWRCILYLSLSMCLAPYVHLSVSLLHNFFDNLLASQSTDVARPLNKLPFQFSL